MERATLPAKPIKPKELQMFRGSFALLMLAETMIFVTAFAARFVFAGSVRPPLNMFLGIVVTLLFVVSALPAGQALRAIAQGRQGTMVRRLGVTFILGLLAFIGIVFDWATLDLDLGSRFGSTYLLATVYHAIHIFAGLITLTALWSSGRKGRFSTQNYWVVEAGVLLWYFIVVTWVALFVVFYLI